MLPRLRLSGEGKMISSKNFPDYVVKNIVKSCIYIMMNFCLS